MTRRGNALEGGKSPEVRDGARVQVARGYQRPVNTHKRPGHRDRDADANTDNKPTTDMATDTQLSVDKTKRDSKLHALQLRQSLQVVGRQRLELIPRDIEGTECSRSTTTNST
jgi:hypothetical protein